MSNNVQQEKATAMLVARIPYNTARRETGAHLTMKSIEGTSGDVPACWNHWLDDGNSYTFANTAVWQKEREGISFLHVLDLSQAQELAVYNLAKSGQLEVSYGLNATPETTRAGVARDNSKTWKHTPGRELAAHPIRHLSYTQAGKAAFPQPAVKIIMEL